MPQPARVVRATLFQKSLLPDLPDQDDPTNAGSSGRVALPVVAASVETPPKQPDRRRGPARRVPSRTFGVSTTRVDIPVATHCSYPSMSLLSSGR